jgi:uncharacterized protein YbjQ (UPF0145 family)
LVDVGAAEPPQPDERAQAQSLARIEAGGLPIAAERRLGELQAGGGTFTSDLSTADFALCHQLGLRPLSQVMGSSIYQVGYQQGVGWMGPARFGAYAAGLVTELDTLTDAWNEARERALGRLALEAQGVGADAVIGVDVRAEARDFGDSSMSSGVIEYSVIGTAVGRTSTGARGEADADQRSQPPRVVLTELSVADYVKLLSAGVEPEGIVGSSSVCFSGLSFDTAVRARSGMLGGEESFELREFTQAIYAAREGVMERMGAQAQSLNASGIVGVRIDHTISRQNLWQGGPTGLLATFHALGTAVRETTDTHPQPPTPTIDLLS